MEKFNIGDSIKVLTDLYEYEGSDNSIKKGSILEVVEKGTLGAFWITNKFADVDALNEDTGWSFKGFEVVNKQQKIYTPNYAAAFNMWMQDYSNNPQAYEDSHDSAVRHLKEKLNGEEPSYGSVCQEILIKYLEKV